MLSSSVRRGSDITGFIVGLFLGAVATALGLVLAGSLIRAPLTPLVASVIVAVAAFVLLLREFGVVSFRLIQNARLVPQFVTTIPFWGPMQFGMEMGTGMRTYSPTGLPHIMAVAIVFLASWPEALAAGAGFALARAVMMLSFTATREKAEADSAFYTDLPRLTQVFAVLFVPLFVLLVVA
ncbi:hypothetical protein [Micromonospora sp. DT229]|uniref:hypothetical protein n=1 Tax=Micromonospora sp. DT229 TaxID=3393430 RepID=UPI003CED88B1